MSRRPTGRAVPAAERMHHWRKRQRARGLKPVVTWIARQGAVRAPGLLDLVYRNFER